METAYLALQARIRPSRLGDVLEHTAPFWGLILFLSLVVGLS